MLAVVKTGGKQYVVKEGDVIDVEKLEGDEGSKISLEVLLTGDDKNVKMGDPTVKGTKVEAEITKQYRAKKVIIQKFKRKTGYRRKRGHRQHLTRLEIKKITA